MKMGAASDEKATVGAQVDRRVKQQLQQIADRRYDECMSGLLRDILEPLATRDSNKLHRVIDDVCGNNKRHHHHQQQTLSHFKDL